MVELSWFSSKNEIFSFDSFGFNGLKEFIIQDDKNIIYKIIYDLNTFYRIDDKITLISVQFSVNEYEKRRKKYLSKLSTAAIYFI